ncbi:protein diaphanous homolog 2-like [Xenopus laevis]|uniref:Protein diaphanous homolog 2-like n=1 Tax=Xenopus laevis TaxID=8355 RepID=A0A8J1LMS8_XENLA|nr:protein diaphanous homolog 2-like [Xenopus laevis]
MDCREFLVKTEVSFCWHELLTQANMMTEMLKILSTICIIGEDNILEKLLEAITTAAEIHNKERFAPIVEALENHEAFQLQASCMQFINALHTSPEELYFRIRYI